MSDPRGSQGVGERALENGARGVDEVAGSGRAPARLPAGMQVLERGYEGPCAWEGGIFRDREEVLSVRAAERGARGGIVLRTRRVVEDSPSLDGARATVGTFDRLYGRLVRVPSRSVNLRVSLGLASVDGTACRVRLVADGALRQVVDVPAEGLVEASIEVALTRRGLDVSAAPELVVPASAEAASEPVVRAEGTCAVELVSLEAAPVAQAPSVPAAAGRPSACPDAASSAPVSLARPTIYIASDSLAQTYGAAVRPQTGWGEALARYLGQGACVVEHDARFDYEQATRYVPASGALVVNAAMAGRSARSFIAEGKLAQVLACVRPGDVLVFQFGANDATRARPLRYATPSAFEGLLDRYVTAARDRGATPVVVTPPPRHNFDAAGRLTIDFAEYADVERAYCAREDVALVDLSARAGEMVAGLGPERSRALYMKLSAGQYASHPDGIDDSTHLSPLGARTFGRIVAQGLAAVVPGLSFTDDAPSGEPVAPAHLQARVDDVGARPGVRLFWDADPAATYYTIDRFEGKDGSCAPARMTALLPDFFDVAAPGRVRQVRYVVRAWRGNAAGPVSEVSVTHEFATGAAAERRITGMDLYEVDAAGIADRINFSVRFNARPGVDEYRVLARNVRTGQITALGTIGAACVDGLHSYGVSREPGWQVYVEGSSADGPCLSDAAELPCHAVDAATARSSWEVPF